MVSTGQKKLFKKLFRISLWTLGIFFFLFFSLIIAIRFPFIQNRLVPLVEKILTNSLGTKIEIGSIGIELPAKAVLNDFYIYDRRDQKAIGVQTVKASLISVSFFRLIFKPGKIQNISISSLEIVNPFANIYISRLDSNPNLVIKQGEPGKPDTTSKGMEINLDLGIILIQNGRFSYIDSTESDEALENRAKVNFSALDIQGVNGNFSVKVKQSKKIQLAFQHFEAKEIRSGLTIDTLQGMASLSDTLVYLDFYRGKKMHKKAEFKNMLIKTGKSRVDFDGISLIDDLGFLFSTENEKIADIHFRPSVFYFNFIQYFADTSFPLQSFASIEGDVSWGMKRIHGDSVKLGLGNYSRMVADVDLIDYTQIECLRMDVNFYNSTVGFEELYSFLPMLDLPVLGTVGLHGRVTGGLDKLSSQNLVITYGNFTRFSTRMRLYNLTSANDLLIDLKFRDSRFSFHDLREILPTAALPEIGMDNGIIYTEGSFLGGLSDFAISADLTSPAGAISAVVHMQTPPKVEKYVYEAQLKTKDLLFNKIGISEVADIELLNFDGTIEGKGFLFDEIETTFKGTITSSILFGYSIDTLKTSNLVIDKKVISGLAVLRDKEGQGDLQVKINLASSPHAYSFLGDVRNLDMNHYHLLKDSIFLTSIVNVKLSGDSIDNLEGKMKFDLLELVNPGTRTKANIRNLAIRTIENKPGKKDIEVSSSVVNSRISGEFNFRQIPSMYSRVNKEIKLLYQNNDSLTRKYYATKSNDLNPFALRFSVQPGGEANDLLTFLHFPVFLDSGSIVSGSFSSGSADHLHVQTKFDTLGINSIGFSGGSVSIDFTKDPGENSIIGIGDIRLDEIEVSKSLKFKDVKFEPSMLDNTIEYWLSGKQPDLKNEFRFNIVSVFLDEGILSRINPGFSELKIGDQVWKVDRHNEILSTTEKVSVRNLIACLVCREDCNVKFCRFKAL